MGSTKILCGPSAISTHWCWEKAQKITVYEVRLVCVGHTHIIRGQFRVDT